MSSAAQDESAGGASDLVTASILVIGDEILSGRTKDKNIGYIADHLTAIGIQLKEVRIVADEEADIVAAINALRSGYDYLFTTGGIGPTHDDITADCVAKAFGVAIEHHPEATEMLLETWKKRGVEATPARMRMARVPVGGRLIYNSVSVAPGFMIGNVVTMAGIPSVMQVMLDDATQYLRTGRKMHSAVLDLELPEGVIADPLGAHQKAFPDVSMGSYPMMRDNRPCCQLVLRSTDEARLSEAVDGLKQRLRDAGLT
jgi:molybdenum cofactor synthesis domain-containing protein